MFVILWGSYWIIGIIDIDWNFDLVYFVVIKVDIDYILGIVNVVLVILLMYVDIDGVYVGLWLLFVGESDDIFKLFWEYVVVVLVVGLVVIVGGKYIIY